MSDQSYDRPTRSGGGAFGTYLMAFMMFSVLIAACVVGAYFFYMGGKEAPKFTVSGFDLEDVKPVQAVDPNYTPTQRTAAASPQPIAGLPGVVAEGTVAPDPAKPAAPKTGDSPSSRISEAQAKREQEWLQRNGTVLRAAHSKLHVIAAKYYKSHPVVRDVDASFAKMPRYMAIKARFDKDGNPYNFARDSIALPEVRAEITRRMADPNAWKAAFAMINEGLKTNPPKGVYDEAKRFLREESDVTDYLATQFQPNLTKNSTAASEAMKTMKPSDMQGLMTMAKDVSPMGAMPMPGAQPPKR
jgi:hypothetical protein